jgi:hypothetical protein
MNPTESGESNSNQVMSPDAVVHLLQLFEQQGIEVVVDGGWGVDALLGAQTHVHADVDVAVEHKDVRSCVRCSQHEGTRMFLAEGHGSVILTWAMSKDMRSVSIPTPLMRRERSCLVWRIPLIP